MNSILKNVPLEDFCPENIIVNLESVKQPKNRLGKFVKLSYIASEEGNTIPFNVEFDNCYITKFGSEYNTEDSIRIKITEKQAQKLDEIQQCISNKAKDLLETTEDENLVKILKVIAYDMKNKANKGDVIFINRKNVSHYFRAVDVEGNTYELESMLGSMNEMEIYATAVVNICPFVSNRSVGSFSRSLQRVLIKQQKLRGATAEDPSSKRLFNCLNC